jgi:hypothetical protein
VRRDREEIRIPALRALGKRLGISLKETTRDARAVLDAVCEGLHAAYRGHPWMRLLSAKSDKADKGPSIPDGNTAAWNDAMRLYIASNNQTQLAQVWSIPLEQRDWPAAALEVLGEPWRHDLPFLRAYIAEGSPGPV